LADAGVTLGALESRAIEIMHRHQVLEQPQWRGDEGEKTVTALPPEIRHLRGPPGFPERRGP
jgi:hypothetical protein